MATLRFGLVCFALALLLPSAIASAQVEPARVDSIKDVVARLRTCWKPPPASRANPGIDITVRVSFDRDGHILGRPRISYESEQATDNDRIAYRIAVMEALQRCTPMPFTEGMAGAVAGRPFAVQFHNRKIPPQPAEKRAWLTPKIL
jgi:allophanate hydrolase subunit 1